MEEASPPTSPTSNEQITISRSRSRSTASNPGGPLATGVPIAARYSPVAHPTTDPSLLALSQQQVADIPIPVEPSLLENGPLSAPGSVAFAIDPALGGGSVDTIPPTVDPVPIIPTSNVEIPVYPDTVEEDFAETEGGLAGEDVATGSSGRNSKRASAVAEDSDAELRRLAEENKNVPLDELARRVRNDENSPAAERTRQVYGLGWLLKNCERVPDSSVAVPRNRVYARYVGICANERIKPLNPASFGKLVRLMFPEIKTRRLGVRGQSKYHYCGIRLAGEHSSPKVTHGSSGSEPPALAAGDDHLQHE